MCGVQDLNARDLLMHLHEWHEMFLRWYEDNMSGKDVPFLPEGFSWKMTPELNKEFWKGYQGATLAEAKVLVRESHKKVMDIVRKHTNEELFTKGYYKWTGTTSLGQYLVSETSSHYDWATKLLKKLK
ncbi:ClbS/DfsB family four-helix bundle protein [Candidatus Saccharibacteria bacterium]|nr:ClbS/DfsB family four-helix bundle protein [Candidatus Saccharibacteria bacterium]